MKDTDLKGNVNNRKLYNMKIIYKYGKKKQI